jgi:flagellar protein FliO/FliZ
MIALLWFGFSLTAGAEPSLSETANAQDNSAILSEELEDQQIADVINESSQELTAGSESTKVAIPDSNTKSNLNEAEIPVLATEVKQAKSKTDPVQRLLISLGVLLAAVAGIFLFSRFWAKRKGGLTQHHQIKVLTQYSLGPKKNLAIVRVAGESILIGITEHNISMIKSLALIDDEFPEDVPQQFAGELSSQTQQPEEDFAFATVRDRVSGRIKQMRSL